MFDKDGIPGAKTVFYSAANNICGSVEEFALEHFRSASDMPEGLHAEGAVFNTLCAVLFWEVGGTTKRRLCCRFCVFLWPAARCDQQFQEREYSLPNFRNVEPLTFPRDIFELASRDCPSRSTLTSNPPTRASELGKAPRIMKKAKKPHKLGKDAPCL